MNIQQAAAKLSSECGYDYATVIKINENGKHSICTAVHWTHYYRYIPFVSIPFALRKIVNIAQEFFTHLVRNKPLSAEPQRLWRSIGRSLIECVPVLGNLISFGIDQHRIHSLRKKIHEEAKDYTSFLKFYNDENCVYTPSSWSDTHDYSGEVNKFINSTRPVSNIT